MKILKNIRILLLPIALLYGIVVRIRNVLFNIKKLKSEEFNVPIISVGNITVGGTGKTPLTEFIIRILKEDYKLALLSRGYKRETKGVVIANALSTVSEIGDEPKQILDKFGEITVAVAEKRVEGVKSLLNLEIAPEVIVMDDAYQHRYVKPGFNILVIDYNRPLWKDLMLPAGELREPIKGKSRANVILFSKCPLEMTKLEQQHYVRKIKPSINQEVYFSTVGYQNICPVFNSSDCLFDGELQNTSVLTVTGIANPLPFIAHIKGMAESVESIRFSDHYQFTQKDIENIRSQFNVLSGNRKLILTTEKDAVRFKQIIAHDSELAKYLFFIPIEIRILEERQHEFKEKIIRYVKQNKRNR